MLNALGKKRNREKNNPEDRPRNKIHNQRLHRTVNPVRDLELLDNE